MAARRLPREAGTALYLKSGERAIHSSRFPWLKIACTHRLDFKLFVSNS
jgi:hypothetical protein